MTPEMLQMMAAYGKFVPPVLRPQPQANPMIEAIKRKQMMARPQGPALGQKV
jgi:hypothetical protein